MKQITLTATFGDKQKKVLLTNPHGSSGVYHIMIDDWYHGQVTKTLDGWHVYSIKNSWLSKEDCDAIREAVEKNSQ